MKACAFTVTSYVDSRLGRVLHLQAFVSVVCVHSCVSCQWLAPSSLCPVFVVGCAVRVVSDWLLRHYVPCLLWAVLCESSATGSFIIMSHVCCGLCCWHPVSSLRHKHAVSADISFLLSFSDLLLDTIRTTDHQTSCEALIYCVGAVKFLTGNSDILKRLARLDCVKVFATLMHNVNKTVRTETFMWVLDGVVNLHVGIGWRC